MSKANVDPDSVECHVRSNRYIVQFRTFSEPERRFHFWSDDTRLIPSSVIYSNPIEKPKYGSYRTIERATDSAWGSKVAEQAIAVIDQRGLFAKAIADEAARKQAEEAERAEVRRINRIKANAAVLYEAAKECRANPHHMPFGALAKLDAVLARIERDERCTP